MVPTHPSILGIHSPMLRVHHDSSGVGHLPLDERLPGLGGLLQPGYANGLLGPVVCPVQVICHPVHSNALNCVDS